MELKKNSFCMICVKKVIYSKYVKVEEVVKETDSTGLLKPLLLINSFNKVFLFFNKLYL
jgi:hypothetical protein